MRTLAVVISLGILALGMVPPPAEAGAATDAALALGAFAVFNQLWAPVYWGYRYGWPYGYPVAPYGYAAPYPYYAYAPPQVAYSAPPSPPPVAVQREVVFPQGRYLLLGDGVTRPYQWVWIPNPPTGPPGPSPGG